MRTTEEEVFDYLGRFIGRRTTNESFLTKVNDNGKVYIPDKPYILSKNVRKEAVRSDGSKVQTTTNFAFHDGHRTSRASRNGTVYFNNKGLPKK